jgi:chromosome segregation ATPase
LSAVGKPTGQPSGDDLSAQVEMAKQRLEEAAAAASTAEKRVAAEIEALESDLENERARASEALEVLRAAHVEELKREREAKEQILAEAQGRLREIEAQAEEAEKRVEVAEKRASDAESTIADERARAREAAAAWLRGQIEAIRREAGRQ